MVSGELADRPHAESGGKYLLFYLVVPQGSILGQMLFNISITYRDDGINRALVKFTIDSKLSGEADTSERRATLAGRPGQAGRVG